MQGAVIGIRMTDLARGIAGPAVARLLAARSGGSDGVGPSALCRRYGVQDGWILLAAVEADQWLSLTQALDRFDLLHNFSPQDALAEPNDGELAETLEATFLTRTVAEWIDRCNRANLPADPVPAGG